MKIFFSAMLLTNLLLLSSCSSLGHGCKEGTQCKMKKEECNECCKKDGMKNGEQCPMHGADADKSGAAAAKK